MARSLRNELDAFMKARIEQNPTYHALSTDGFQNLSADEMNRVVWHVVGVHREALLWLAGELDELAIGQEDKP